MKQRRVLPWHIKPGMRAAFGDRNSASYSNRYRILTVVKVKKERSVFTSGFVWRVTFDNGEVWPMFGQSGGLQATRMKIEEGAL